MLVDHDLSGLIVGLTLATRPEDVYRALIEATAFGTRKIVETFGASGVPVTEFVAAGGLLKNEFLMQTYANILRMPVATCASAQAPALGSAIHAAVAAGAYPDVTAAGDAMGGRSALRYLPDKAAADAYDRLYAEYTQLHDYFGRRRQRGHAPAARDAQGGRVGRRAGGSGVRAGGSGDEREPSHDRAAHQARRPTPSKA